MKISIITVCKNASSDIEGTILSVVNQSYQDYEYIIVDGDSNDGTKEIIERYRHFVDVYVSEKDRGIYSAMNKGILLSNGKYLLFLNAGDTLAGIDILSDIARLWKDEDIVIGKIITDGYLVNPRWNTIIDRYCLFCKSPPHQASFIKKDLFNKIGNYRESLVIFADWEYFLRAIIKFKCKLKQVDLIISYFQLGGISSQKKYYKLKHKEAELLRREYYSFITYIFYKLRYSVQRLYISGFIHLLKRTYMCASKYLFERY